MIAFPSASTVSRARGTVSAHSEPAQYKPLIVIESPRLKVALLAQVEYDAHQVIVTDLTTGIFGVGPTAESAVSDFLAALRDHAHVLSAQPAISPNLQTQLEYLRRHLHEG